MAPVDQAVQQKLGLIVCADDFGMSAQVNDAIIRLLSAKRISAVSCLVQGPEWKRGAVLLSNFRGLVDIGLHLYYEDMPFKKIMALACCGGLDKKKVHERFKSQLECFRLSMGSDPDYIDGHQHIHQLPVFKEALIELIDSLGLNKVYVRNSGMGLNDILKRRISVFKNMAIALPGNDLKKQLIAQRIPTNNDLLGIYNFHADRDTGEILEKFLRTVDKKNSILISHPHSGKGLMNALNLSIDKRRVEEFRYLESERYIETLDRCGLYLTRFT